MTDQPDPTEPVVDADGPLTPDQESAVRRALAAAGGPEPMPGEIVDRLDTVIAGLAAERSAPEISHPEDHRVLPLDAHARRRRVRARILLAAAAVVVAGAVGAGIINDRNDDSFTTADQASAEDPARSAAGDQDGALDSGGLSDSATTGEQEPEAAAPDVIVEPRRIVTDESLREVRPDRLREDLVALQHSTLPHPATADYSGATLTAPSSFVCEPAAFGNGYLVGVLYDGKPAIAAFRERVGQTQAAEVLACGTGDVLHSTTLPATG